MKKLRWLGTHYIFGNNILSTVIEARVPICLFAVIPWMINNNYVGGASLGHVVSKWQEIGNCRNIVVVRENSIQSHFLHRLHLLSADSTWQPGKNSRSHTMCSFLSKLIIFGLQFHGTHNPEKWTGSKMALRDRSSLAQPHLWLGEARVLWLWDLLGSYGEGEVFFNGTRKREVGKSRQKPVTMSTAAGLYIYVNTI